jgi:hypothetical protein
MQEGREESIGVEVTEFGEITILDINTFLDDFDDPTSRL